MSARRISPTESNRYFEDTKVSHDVRDLIDKLLPKGESAGVPEFEPLSDSAIAAEDAHPAGCVPVGSDHESVEARYSSWWANYLTNL
jgi:hypothetical protein